MAHQVPYGEPTTFRAGSSVQWDVAYGDYPASDGWQLAYYLRGEEDLDFAWATHVTAEGAGFEVRIPATFTGVPAGSYTLFGRVTKDAEAFDVYTGRLLVLANPVAAVAAKSFNRRMLDAIEAALEDAIATSATKVAISVNGRSVTYLNQQEAEQKRAHYAVLVAIEENPNGRLEHAVEFTRV